MRWRSTTLRFAVLVFLLQLASGIALMLLVGSTVRRAVQSEATVRADTLRDDLLVTYGQGGIRALAQAVRLRSQRGAGSNTVLLLADPAGRPIAGNVGRWPAGAAPTGRHVEMRLIRIDRTTPEETLVRATRLPDGARLLTGGVVESERRVLRSLGRAAILGLVMAILFAALAAWLAAKMIVGRMGRTVAALDAARSGDLSSRVEQDRSGDAFSALAQAVNATLERLDGLVRELKIATDALAHDLKSPLTRLRSALERAAIEVQEPAAQQSVDRALAEGDRVLAIVETALSISRAEAGVGRESFKTTNLAAELNDIAEIYGPVAESDDRGIVVTGATDIALPVHRELLGQALGNLIDNSLKYGAGTITLSLTRGPGTILIAVGDRGAGIAADRREQALARFGRLDAARRASGAGLGLSLVQAVARLHGGTLALEDAEPGLVATICLPASPVSNGLIG